MGPSDMQDVYVYTSPAKYTKRGSEYKTLQDYRFRVQRACK